MTNEPTRCDTDVEVGWNATGGTLLAVSGATFVLLLDITVVNVALPSIRQDLDASCTDLQRVVGANAG